MSADALREIADDIEVMEAEAQIAADEIERLRAQVADLPRYEALVAELRDRASDGSVWAAAYAAPLARHGFGES